MMRKCIISLCAALILPLVCSTGLTAQESGFSSTVEEAQKYIATWKAVRASMLADEALQTASGPEQTAWAEYLKSLTSFYMSDYGNASVYARKALDAGILPEDEAAYLQFIDSASSGAPDFKEIETEHFVIRYAHPKDRVVALYARDVLEKSHFELGLDFDTYPDKPVVVEIYPDMDSFTLASTLPAENVEKTGVVGICKFNRIMALSPRLLPKGYSWSDTLSHEFVHYLIFIKTGNTVPVWLHEGIAKYKENRWKDGKAEIMSPYFETILARALSEDSLVPIEKMHPSLALLDSAREAQLAFAQSRATVSFLVGRWGEKALPGLLDAITETGDYRKAVKQVTGLTFDEFYESWREDLREQGLKELVPDMDVKGIRISNTEGNSDDDSRDLVDIDNSKARDFTRLGDMMKSRGRLVPAAYEYEKALSYDPFSPVISTRLAVTLLESGHSDKARDVMGPALELYPEHMDILMTMGLIYMESGNLGKALETYQEANAVNPFDPSVHTALETIYTERGETDRAALEKQILDILYDRQEPENDK